MADNDDIGHWWQRTWDERGAAVRAALGETVPPGLVTSFSWEDPRRMLPGACAMVFGPTPNRPMFLHMTLGQTQPLEPGGRHADWEFAIYTRDGASWANELLYDLVTGWAEQPDWLQPGHFLPASFFYNAAGSLDCAAADLRGKVSMVGHIRGLYLWPSLQDKTLIQTGSGSFFIMAATLVTADEESLADEASPPHLLLLLKQLGVNQLSDPMRQSVRQMSRFEVEWDSVRRLSHADAVRCLNAREPARPQTQA